jgi:PTS system mannose-specific IIA component
MIGVVICAHHTLAPALAETAETIVGEYPALTAVAVDYGDAPDVTREHIQAAIREVDSGQGVLLLCDMFGGTPSNLSLSLLSDELEVVTGVNLPMLLKLFTERERGELSQVAATIRDDAREKIMVAGELLRPRKKK